VQLAGCLISGFCVTIHVHPTPISMREQEEPEPLPAVTETASRLVDLSVTAPILAGKLARLPPEQLAVIFPRMNSVGPL